MIKNENKGSKKNFCFIDFFSINEANDILTILSKGEYCIPFDTEFYEEFKGKIGKIKIKWITPSLNEYGKNIENNDNNILLINESTIYFPFIMVNNLELSYKYDINMNEKKEILLNIIWKNKTK